MIHLRTATVEDSDAIVRLNHEAVAVTSAMDADRYRELLAISDYASVVDFEGKVAAFLLGIGEGRLYDNGNYLWFSERITDYLYIDRVVVDGAHRGIGLGQRLYAHLFEWALSRQLSHLAAEFDIEPPNLASLAFHDRHGFVELGTRVLDNGKLVSMRVKSLGVVEVAAETDHAQSGSREVLTPNPQSTGRPDT
jgi:predicted GNAT superfamily acetyltransferase